MHALLVPIRDEQGSPAPGVTIEDCGAKAGLAGVDNGRLGFDQVRVPREALLDRYATVAADGTYASPIALAPAVGSSPCSAPSSAAGSASPAPP